VCVRRGEIEGGTGGKRVRESLRIVPGGGGWGAGGETEGGGEERQDRGKGLREMSAREGE